MTKPYDWIVVGAGIIGTLAAWRLAQRGFHVALVDQGSPGHQATGAAAGILSPLAEAEAAGPFVELMRLSLARYSDMVGELREEAHMDLDYHVTGVLQLARDADCASLRERSRWQQRLGAQWLDERDIRTLEPDLVGYSAALYDPAEGQVHPPLLVQAAVRASLMRGVVPYFGSPVQSLLVEKETVQGVALPRQQLWASDGVLIAAGAWSGLLAGEPYPPLPVEPVRGQVMSVTVDRVPLRHIAFEGHTYVVPKRDGRLVVGATEDMAGFDSRVTAAGITRLTEILRSFGLSRSDVYLEKVWAGLRPKVVDGLPVLGACPAKKSLYIATGHYRNGVLLAAVTADLVAGWATGASDPIDLTPFRPDRFSTTG